MPHRIKIIFSRLIVTHDGDLFGSGEFYFDASIGGRSIGDDTVFDANEGRTILLDEDSWAREIDIDEAAYRSGVDIRFQVHDKDVFVDDDMGLVQDTIGPPWEEKPLRYPTTNFTLEGRVELQVGGSFGSHSGDAIFICRQERGAAYYNTVSGRTRRLRLELHPVRPVPATGLPRRPPVPHGAPPPAAGRGGGSAPAARHWLGEPAVGAGPPVPPEPNIIPNPAVIPIFPADDANERTAARIEVTYYRPGELNFTEDDPRLEWTATPIDPGTQVIFVGQPRGTCVFVYGANAGQIRLEVRFQGALVAQYRAVVREIRQIHCRFNILNGPRAASQPRARPEDVMRHWAIANLLLRQLGIELVRDTNRSVRNNARRVRDADGNIIDGIFRIRVPRTWTSGIGDAGGNRAVRLNYRRTRAGRQRVLNFAYIQSDSGGNRGVGWFFPDSKRPRVAAAGNRPTIVDNGSPSSSWIRPGTPPGSDAGSGVDPDTAAGNVTMRLINGIPDAHNPRLAGMYVTDASGDAQNPNDDIEFAGTIAHELGHMLNLGHRVEGADATEPTGWNDNGIFYDYLAYPPTENVMHWSANSNVAQDFDILQALGVWESPLANP
jgi:hypothetical protein